MSVQERTGLFWKVFKQVKKFPVFLLFFMKTTLLLTSKKKLKIKILVNSLLIVKNRDIYLTDKFSYNITFTGNNIWKITKDLDTKQAHDRDMIRVCMLKLWEGPIHKHLRLIFSACLDQEMFSVGKKQRCSY